MRVYLLPDPRPMELAVRRILAKSPKNLAYWKIFPNGEIFVRVSGAKGPVCMIGRAEPPGDNFFKTILLLDTLHRAGAGKITLVLPYFAYSRQNRKKYIGDALTSATLTSTFASTGASRIVTVDLHSDRVISESPIPIINVNIIPEIASALKSELRHIKYSIVAPDHGSLSRSRAFARVIGHGSRVIWFEKKRRESGTIVFGRVHGKLLGTTAVLVDDILDTGQTIQGAVRLLRNKGFRTFYLCITHPVFSGNAIKIVRDLKFRRILISDTLPISRSLFSTPRLAVVSAQKKLVEAVLSEK